MSKLIIVESPAKCKKIEEYVGNEYKCVASFGHLTTLSDLKSIDVNNNYTPNFTIIKEKHKYVTMLQKKINESSEIFLASDDDREGEAIAWHICKLFDLPVNSTKRIIFHEITKSAVQEALKYPKFIDLNIVQAQQTRQILDILVGFKFSPLLWKHISPAYKDGLSAGRCQTPALRLIYDNEIEINNNPGDKKFIISGFFTKNNVKFELNKKFDDEKIVMKFLNLSPSFQHTIQIEKTHITTTPPPIPFSTSLLQQKAHSYLNLSPKETMKLAQNLYEEGLITYMRTDNKKYSNEFCNGVKEFIINNYTDSYVGDVSKHISENANNAHEAIRPTKITNLPDRIVTKNELTSKARNLYKLIWKNSVESLMADSKKEVLPIKITAPEDLYYKYSCDKVIFDGWKILENSDNNEYYAYFSLLKNNSVINYNKITAKEGLQNKKTHLNYAQLIKLLEEKGIGRPSTFASIVDKIISRGYVKNSDIDGDKKEYKNYELIDKTLKLKTELLDYGKEKNKLVLEPLGFIVLEFLLHNFNSFFDYDFTSLMENELDQISSNTKIWHNVCSNYDTLINNNVNELKLDNGYRLCYKIDDKHELMVAKYGVVIKNNEDIFSKVKENINMFKVTNNEYKIGDIIQEKINDDLLIGKYNDENLYMKKGKYGKYLAWGKNTKSLDGYDGDIELTSVVQFIENKSNNKNIIRVIDNNISIRNGKYGAYIFYKTDKMKKPQFFKLYGFPNMDNLESCKLDELKSWIKSKYDI